MSTNIDPKKYISIGVHPDDVKDLDAEAIAHLEAKLAMTPEERQKRLADKFDEAILVAKDREAKMPKQKM